MTHNNIIYLKSNPISPDQYKLKKEIILKRLKKSFKTKSNPLEKHFVFSASLTIKTQTHSCLFQYFPLLVKCRF